MIARPALLAALLLVSQLAGAEALYKCTDAKGFVSIQSEACPKGSTQVWKREATPDPAPSPEELAARAALAQAEAERIAETARLAEERRKAAQARIDEDKRLWKDLLWRDFRWRKDRHRGKGRKKKNQLREFIRVLANGKTNYELRYHNIAADEETTEEQGAAAAEDSDSE